MKTNTLILIVAAVASFGLTVDMTYLSILEGDSFGKWFPLCFWLVVLVITLKACLEKVYSAWWYKRHLEMEATGIYDFVRSATMLEDMREVLRARLTTDEKTLRFVRIVQESYHQERDVRGVVCGEEIVGVAEGVKLVVTVTKPETAKAFRRLPRETREWITVVYVGE